MYLFPPCSTVKPLLKYSSGEVDLGKMVFQLLLAASIPKLENPTNIHSLGSNQNVQIIDGHSSSLLFRKSAVKIKFFRKMRMVLGIAQSKYFLHVVIFLFSFLLSPVMLGFFNGRWGWISYTIPHSFYSLTFCQRNFTLREEKRSVLAAMPKRASEPD